MKTIVTLLRKILPAAILLYCCLPAIAQKKQPKHPPVDGQLKDFYLILAQADLNFTFPAGFKQIQAINNEDFSFDYSMEIPGKDFEAWFEVKSQKENWASYVHAQYDKKTELANPDSMYLDIGKANATALTGNKNNYSIRNISPEVLIRYNADAGKSCLLNLLDLEATKHYKYALLITLQKKHTGTLVAIYFTNEKDPEFYRNVYRASHSLKFKPTKI
jgi:hypothetical protein